MVKMSPGLGNGWGGGEGGGGALSVIYKIIFPAGLGG